VDTSIDEEEVTTGEGDPEAVTEIDESEVVINTDEELVDPAEGRVESLRANDEGEVESKTLQDVDTGDGVTDATSRDSISTSDGELETLHKVDINKYTIPFLKHYLKRIKQLHSQGNKLER